jgi:nucleotide-binding universal stress UspA family protein
MKKLLILTDFSAIASHAAGYGYELAIQLKADVILCNAAIIAADVPLAGLAAWPLEERDTYLLNSEEEINLLKTQLEQSNLYGIYRPAMTFVADPGTLIHVLDDTLNETKVDLVVMGAHGGDNIHTFLLDNRCMNMIKTMHKPLLMVPPGAKFSAIRNITFVTDTKNCIADVKFISLLFPLAKQLGAGLSVSCLDDGSKETSPELAIRMNNALGKLSNEDHPAIIYTMKSGSQIGGFDALHENGETGILAVIHRPDNFFDKLLHESGTTKPEHQFIVPLLVLKG